ncbi:hypothetical protein [Arthrobacter sp. StoSoilB5]|uniref:hypothetical protein n=1 Tax=Arthrobacter sp. StoSoilB5 TaxID=2830992 RepID=UPI001CC58E5C|nr:hypothetical protein [Arthrobacter sp. StoSoilB5]BCW45194.1 hypothetical protein StoSoilB5_23780 [Arthrobacter sp. StoSoilB5]
MDKSLQIPMLTLLGDYHFQDPGHHGTPDQRSKAFMAGYNSGVPASCDPWLVNNY